MATFKTPGIYIQEIPNSPPTVAEVETAIPAFIGYTQISTTTLRYKALKISSLQEYEAHFGKAPDERITVTLSERAVNGIFPIRALSEPSLTHYLYYSMCSFFENGGGDCYVVSVGETTAKVSHNDLLAGLEVAAKEDAPTLIVMPDAALLDDGINGKNYATVIQAALKQCGERRDRFAILDVTRARKSFVGSEIDSWRALLGNNHLSNTHLSYGAAYYPFIKTQMHYLYSDNSVRLLQPDERSDLDRNPGPLHGLTLAALKEPLRAKRYGANYDNIHKHLDELFVTLPPSAAVAGVYVSVDKLRGVWKAPANVDINGTPLVPLDDSQQAPLNVDAGTGKSINAIRSFTAKGTLIWGARTLAGNDNEWRYVSVRRFFNMVEESLIKSTAWTVFEPNDSNTWVRVRSMIENYLTLKWRDGALMGATPQQAFFVRCGLGQTMTQQDLLDGRIIVEVGMAMVRPAEFIILTFAHAVQKR